MFQEPQDEIRKINRLLPYVKFFKRKYVSWN